MGIKWVIYDKVIHVNKTTDCHFIFSIVCLFIGWGTLALKP